MDNLPTQSDFSAFLPLAALNVGFHDVSSNCVRQLSPEPWTRIPLQGLQTVFVPPESQPWPTRGTMFWSERDRSYVFHPDRNVAVLVNALPVSQPSIPKSEAAQQIHDPSRGNCEVPGKPDSPGENVTTRNQNVDLRKAPPPKNLKQEENEEKEEIGCVVDGLKDFDVLCGRGEHVNRHPGNKIFHDEKVKLQPRYLRAIKRKEKTAIAQELVDLMKSRYGSRFLGYSSEKKQYYIIDHRRVLEKSKQVLRETFTPEQRKIKRERYFRPKKKMFYAQCLADLRNAKA